ncbi:MAG: hypothetical protein ACRDWI_14370 [Jiangellaceae bacterium]
MTSTARTDAEPGGNRVMRWAGQQVDFVDQRVTASPLVRRSLRRVFPDHWSFWLGEVALFSFILIILSGEQ